jgi:hypothetical protein
MMYNLRKNSMVFSDFTNRPVAPSDRAFKTTCLELLQCVTKCLKLNAITFKNTVCNYFLFEQTGVKI